MAFDAKKVKNEIVKWIQDFFYENGKDCNAVVGISGGKDSSVVAALCVEALGKDRVIGVLMPQGNQPDIDYSKMLCDHLGIVNFTVDIFNVCRNIKHQVKDNTGGHWSAQSSTNLPARIRMAVLYAVSQTVNGRVANTCNLSEDWVGYATRYGDAAGDFSPLSRLTVTEVKAIGRNLVYLLSWLIKCRQMGFVAKQTKITWDLPMICLIVTSEQERLNRKNLNRKLTQCIKRICSSWLLCRRLNTQIL